MTATATHEFHPYADLFPLLEGEEFDSLVADIKQRGLRQPVLLFDGKVLDGRNRLRACEVAGVKPRFETVKTDDPIGLVLSLNLMRRHLTASQRGMVAVDVEEVYVEEARERQRAAGREHGRGQIASVNNDGSYSESEDEDARERRERESRTKAAKKCNVSTGYVTAAKAIAAADPELAKKVRAGEVTIPKATKKIRDDQHKRDLDAAQKKVSASKRKAIESVCDLRVCSCADLFASGIKPDAVITDPPYPAEFLPVFTELAEGCAAAGVPVVAVMSGQSYLPEVLRRLCEHLQYRWTLAYMTPGGQAVQQWQAKVNTSWKPVLLFGDAAEWFGDVATSKANDNDKRFHGWGQSESGMADLVERLTKPGQLVCDPFLGGGTTAVVTLALGRRFVGCDVDAEHVKQARARVTA